MEAPPAGGLCGGAASTAPGTALGPQCGVSILETIGKNIQYGIKKTLLVGSGANGNHIKETNNGLLKGLKIDVISGPDFEDELKGT
ncbi:hypothetical protein RND71_040891 [Anisodus tanguticus]|uniref:Uncharacterized protein n=1 Tax=Anisodus tanguticus TaxID=243964 RepID=A0AAE1UW67_9SOLA|nr:hypothetical protein RND71_040891 [Anisodus tanguticus]